jgi:hypothetical protein
VVVRVEDADDEAVEAEQHDDREQHLAQADGEGVERGRRLVAREQRHEDRRDEDEDERQRAERDEQQPGERRRDVERLAPAPLLEQLAENGHEGGGERGVRDQRPDQVRHLEGERERRHRARGAEIAASDDLACQPGDAREAREDGEDRGVAGAAGTRRCGGGLAARGGRGGRGQSLVRCGGRFRRRTNVPRGERQRLLLRERSVPGGSPPLPRRELRVRDRGSPPLSRRERRVGCGCRMRPPARGSREFAAAGGAAALALEPRGLPVLRRPRRRRFAARPSHSGAL